MRSTEATPISEPKLKDSEFKEEKQVIIKPKQFLRESFFKKILLFTILIGASILYYPNFADLPGDFPVFLLFTLYLPLLVWFWVGMSLGGGLLMSIFADRKSVV